MKWVTLSLDEAEDLGLDVDRLCEATQHEPWRRPPAAQVELVTGTVDELVDARVLWPVKRESDGTWSRWWSTCATCHVAMELVE